MVRELVSCVALRTVGGRDLLYRLYRTKLALLATISIVLGIALLVVARVTTIENISALPVKDIGSALFTTGLIAVVFEYIDSRNADQRVRDSVVSGFAFAPETLAQIASPATLDRIVENCLTVRLGDRALAVDMYADLREQTLSAGERHHNTNVSITLTPWTGDPAADGGIMFVATVRWEYHALPPTGARKFMCVSNPSEYRNLLRDPTTAGVWLLEPIAGLHAGSPDVFHLDEYTIDGTPQPIQHTRRRDATIYNVPAPPISSAGDRCPISFTYRVLVERYGHLLFIEVNKPSKGLNVAFAYNGCGIRHVNVVDFLAGPRNSRIHRSPHAAPTSTINIGYDGWIFPNSGLAYIWTLNHERQHAA